MGPPLVIVPAFADQSRGVECLTGLWADVNMAGEWRLFPLGSAEPEVRLAFERGS
jgi:hypothetical protein